MTEKAFDPAAEIERVRAEVMAAPLPGSDPDTRRRNAKIKAANEAASRAAGHVAEPDDDEVVKVKRSAQPSKVQGRSATPPARSKAAEEK